MKAWKYTVVPILFVIGGLGWLLRVVKQLIREEPISGAAIVFACMFFSLAIVSSVAAARKSSGDFGPRSIPVDRDQSQIKA
jgi:hypothetical protein